MNCSLPKGVFAPRRSPFRFNGNSWQAFAWLEKKTAPFAGSKLPWRRRGKHRACRDRFSIPVLGSGHLGMTFGGGWVLLCIDLQTMPQAGTASFHKLQVSLHSVCWLKATPFQGQDSWDFSSLQTVTKGRSHLRLIEP